MEKFIALAKSEYNEGVLLNEYKGSYSLVVAKKKGDEVYMEWCFPQKRDGSKEPMDKSLPWKVKIGDSKEEAFEMLKQLINSLTGKTTDESGEIPW